jgi:hypothetical protein
MRVDVQLGYFDVNLSKFLEKKFIFIFVVEGASRRTKVNRYQQNLVVKAEHSPSRTGEHTRDLFYFIISHFSLTYSNSLVRENLNKRIKVKSNTQSAAAIMVTRRIHSIESLTCL